MIFPLLKINIITPTMQHFIIFALSGARNSMKCKSTPNFNLLQSGTDCIFKNYMDGGAKYARPRNLLNKCMGHLIFIILKFSHGIF